MEKRYNFYIITLFESNERVENVKKVEATLKERGYHVEIIPAYYYKTVDIFTIMNREGIQYTNKDLSLSLTQLGCFLSHREAWKRIQKRIQKSSSSDVHIILEDDMNIDGELCDVNIEYDAIIMWRHPSQMNTPVTYVKEGLLHFYNQWGMCAYALTPTCAGELLEIKEIDTPVDLLLYRDFYPNKRVYVTETSPFINLGFLGTNTDFTYKSWIYS